MDSGVLFNILQIIWGILLTAGYIPQILKTIKTKDVDSFSMNYMVLVSIGITLMQTYAIHLYMSTWEGLAFLITNTLSWLCALIMLWLTISYRKT